jgi:hypothetical protein
MDKERMLLLADVIEKKELPMEFDMGTLYNEERGIEGCQTSGCIVGHAALLFGLNPLDPMQVGEALGLTFEQSQRLFYNFDHFVSERDLNLVSREEAVEAIRKMVREVR